jgi:hypothetical protein
LGAFRGSRLVGLRRLLLCTGERAEGESEIRTEQHGESKAMHGSLLEYFLVQILFLVAGRLGNGVSAERELSRRQAGPYPANSQFRPATMGITGFRDAIVVHNTAASLGPDDFPFAAGTG